MQYVNIPVSAAAEAYRSIRAARDILAALPTLDTDQLPLPFEGVDQALDAAMEERSALKADISLLEGMVDESLGLIGTMDQIIDAHMDEREELKRRIAAAESEASDFQRLYKSWHEYGARSMDTRAVLKREVRNVSDKVHRQRGAINGKDREIAALEDILLESARYHIVLRERLAAMGITIDTNPEGLPDITVNIIELSNSMDRAFGIA